MRRKAKDYLVLGTAGLLLVIVSLVLEHRIPDTVGATATAIGMGLFAYGFSKFRTLRWEEKEPEIMRKAQIEANDERNVAIRRRAQAVSGEVLQWTVMAAAWVSIGLDAPLWVTVAAVGVFLSKSFLDLFLIFHYRKQM